MPPKKSTVKTKTRKSVPKALRMKLWTNTFGETFNGSCYVCNTTLNITNFEAGHIVAQSNGGKTTIDNLKVVCKLCNKSCGSDNLNDFKTNMISKSNQSLQIAETFEMKQTNNISNNYSKYIRVNEPGDFEKILTKPKAVIRF